MKSFKFGRIGTRRIACLVGLLILLAPGPAGLAERSCNSPPPQVRPDENNDSPQATKESENRPIDLKCLPRRVLIDQAYLWVRRFRLGKEGLPWAGVNLGTTAGLIAIDRRAAQEIFEKPPGSGFEFARRAGQIGGPLTDVGTSGIFYLVGCWRGDEQIRTSALLGWEAIADSTIITGVAKVAPQRPGRQIQTGDSPITTSTENSSPAGALSRPGMPRQPLLSPR